MKQPIRKISKMVLVTFLAGTVPTPTQASNKTVLGALPNLDQLIAQCAPEVHPRTMKAIILSESSGNPWRINFVESPNKLAYHPTNYLQAVNTAKMLKSQGWHFASGLGQLTTTNVKRFKLTWEEVFDPCTNIKYAQVILQDCFRATGATNPNDQGAIQRAISCYNTGNGKDGLKNGYVDTVKKHAARITASTSDFSPPVSSGGGSGSNPEIASNP